MLKGKCFFPLLRLVKKIDIKEELKKLAIDVTGKSDEEKERITKEKGIELLFLLAERLGEAEKETFEFVSVYLEKTIQEVKEMDILEISELLKTLFTDEKFKVFFQQAMK